MDPLNGGAGGGEGGDSGDGADDLGAAMRGAAAGEGGEGGEGGGEGAGEDAGAGEGGEGAEGGAAGGDHKPLTPQEQRAMAQELSEIRAWRAEQEQNAASAAKDKPAVKESPKPMTDQEFSQLEARAGFIRSKVKNETTGEMEERMSIDPRKQLEFVSGMVEHGLNALRQEFETMLHDNVSSLRRQDLFSELEKDPSKEFSDIRQFSKGIADFLERYPAKDRTNRKFVVDGYYWAKGRGLKDVVKKIEDKRNLNARVTHPGGGNGKPGGGAGNGAARPAGPAAAFLDKFDPVPAGKK